MSGIRIYLIRHGQTEWNRESRIQGREDVPLCQEGVEQAHELAEKFRGTAVSAVLTSPLSRAETTARLIAGAAGAPVYVEPDLTERDFGSVSGRVVDIFNPEKYASDLEPLDQVAARALAVMRRYARELGDDFAAVSHGGTINAVLRAVSGGEIGSGKTRLINAGINVLRCDNGSFQVLGYNMTSPEGWTAHAGDFTRDGQAPLF